MSDKKPDNLQAALAVALPKLEGAKKDANNPHFKAKYATLGAVIEAIKPVAEHGLWYLQVELERENGAAYETFYIGHGERMSAGITFVPADRNNAQGFGSARTYARRYGLMSAFGLATEDDDGNAAASAPPAKQEAEPIAMTISNDDWTKIAMLAKATKTTSSAIKKEVGADNLKTMTQEQLNAAFEYLENKLGDAAKAQSDAKQQSLSEEIGDEIPY